jgi:hypothetical protein
MPHALVVTGLIPDPAADFRPSKKRPIFKRTDLFLIKELYSNVSKLNRRSDEARPLDDARGTHGQDFNNSAYYQK